MPITLTGRNVTVASGHPSLIDIAVGLSRQPRFSGQTTRWWSVLDHSLFCDELALTAPFPPVGADEIEGRRRFRLAVLLHDAHEALTGDVPTPLKNDGLRATQNALDTGIFDAFVPGGLATIGKLHHAVKLIDRRAMAAEALVVGPPAIMDGHQASFGITDSLQVDEDAEVLRRLLRLGKTVGLPPVTFPLEPTDHVGVRAFLTRILGLL